MAGSVLLIRKEILKIWKKYKRGYPWRRNPDPYRIMVAEFMFQRTKADQVEQVYNIFFSSFKTPYDVAKANMKKLNRILYPIGLRWRIKKFKQVSESIINNFNGKIPDSREDILKLPGVGDYVAGIVLSVAFGKKEWIVDSNVVRIFKRYFGIPTSKEGRRDRHVIEIAKKYVSCKCPGNANLSLLDFSALICSPRVPKHEQCPLRRKCRFLLNPQE